MQALLSEDRAYLDPQFAELVWLQPAFQESRSEYSTHVSMGRRAEIFRPLPEVEDPIEPHLVFAVAVGQENGEPLRDGHSKQEAEAKAEGTDILLLIISLGPVELQVEVSKR